MFVFSKLKEKEEEEEEEEEEPPANANPVDEMPLGICLGASKALPRCAFFLTCPQPHMTLDVVVVVIVTAFTRAVCPNIRLEPCQGYCARKHFLSLNEEGNIQKTSEIQAVGRIV